MNRKFVTILTALYGIPNLLSFFFVFVVGYFSVDMRSIAFTAGSSSLIWIASLFFLILIAFAFLVRNLGYLINYRRNRYPPTIIGRIVFFAQIVSLLATILTGYGKVGGRYSDPSFISITASYLSADSLFIIYYCHVREKKLPFVNITIYILSNLYRGWSGIWLILTLFEYYFLLKRTGGAIITRKFFIFGLLGISLLPVVNELKDAARSSDFQGWQTYNNIDYENSSIRLMDRLQLAGAALLISQDADSIAIKIKSGSIQPWYHIRNVTTLISPIRPDSLPLQKYISEAYLIDAAEVGSDVYINDLSWYTHTGIIGWLFVLSPFESFFYITFVTIIICLPYLISYKFIQGADLLPALHVASFVYVFHGWFDVQRGFIFALILYAIACKSSTRKITF